MLQGCKLAKMWCKYFTILTPSPVECENKPTQIGQAADATCDSMDVGALMTLLK